MPLNFDDPDVKKHAQASKGLDKKSEIQRQYEAGKRCLRLRSLKKELSSAHHTVQIEHEEMEKRKGVIRAQVSKLQAAYNLEHARYQEAARQLQGCNIRDTISRARALTEERDRRERVNCPKPI
jgi:hypothetical protein